MFDTSELPPLSKAAYVARRLRDDLANGLVSPGDTLNQGKIASRYGVSATPVREALRILEADGLVVYSPHKGATVADLPSADIHDLYIFRRNVEGLTAALAVERATPEQIAKLRQKHDELKTGVSNFSPEKMSRLNREFHLAIMMIGSPFIATHVMRPLWERIIPPRHSLWTESEKVQTFIDAHERIVRAIEEGDATLATHCVQDHIATAGDFRDANARSESAPRGSSPGP